MIEYVQATNEDILSIQPQFAQGEGDDLQLGFSVFADNLVRLDGRAISINCDGECIGAYGVIEIPSRVGWVWALFSKRLLDHHWLSLGRHAKQDLEKVDQMGFKRLQVTTHPDHAEGMEYLEWLGFKCKKRVQRHFLNGDDGLLYERVCNVV